LLSFADLVLVILYTFLPRRILLPLQVLEDEARGKKHISLWILFGIVVVGDRSRKTI